MQVQQPLTKENFWNEMMEKFPNATKLFCNWIDEYKEAVNWKQLFGYRKYPPHGFGINEVKYHDLPHAMQQGIFIEFIRQKLGNYFEQIERHMSDFYDFEEDVKTVFSEIEAAEAA